MRGLSSQFVQTAELRLIQVPRKLRNCELRFAGFCRNCETAPKPRHLLQNCRTTDCGRRSFVKNQEPRTVVEIMGQKPRKNCGKTALREMRGLSSQFGQTAKLRLIPGA